MSRRGLVHPGFHKTGTTSLQDALAEHRALLAPHLQVIGLAEIPAVCRAARAYLEVTLEAIAAGHPQNCIDDLLPRNFQPSS